jgi:LmbE family N-acetylglucosaminyl deacetylase
MSAKTAQVMVVTPHPDDAEFGVAGTIACQTREDREVVLVVCTNGDKGTSDRNMSPEELARIRENEQRAAAKVLGVREVIFLGYPDQGLEYTPELRKQLVRLIRTYQPETVITVDPYRRYFWWHRDHRICGQVVMDAIFPYARDHLAYPDLLDEGLEPHKVKELLLANAEEPNYRVNITETFELKLAALLCHQSQVAGFAPDLEERLRKWARDAAREEEFELAEAFHRVVIDW